MLPARLNGRRVKKHVDSEALGTPNGVDTYVHMYYNTGWQLVETRETDTESTAPDTVVPEHQFVWSTRYIDAPILREDFTVYGVMDGRIYYLTDANFNVTALVGEEDGGSWTVWERYMYDPYGVVTVLDGCSTGDADNPGGENDTEWDADPDGVSDYLNPILSCGYYRDLETGLYHVRRRPYHAHLGRFTARDLLEYVDGMNLLQYGDSNPVRAVDPMGEDASCVCCCVKSANIENVKALGRPLWGHSFDVAIELEYFEVTTGDEQQAGKLVDCKLQWFEYTDKPYAFGQPANEWADLNLMWGSIASTLRPWRNRAKEVGKETTVIRDTPLIRETKGENISRTIYFGIRLSTGRSDECRKACIAKNGVSSTTLFAKQWLTLVNGRGTNRGFRKGIRLDVLERIGLPPLVSKLPELDRD